MNISTKQPGSALLTVLLILTALAAIMLFATRSTLTATRTLSRQDNASLARQMAQSGIDEGLLQLKKDGTGSPIENSANPPILSRGFSSADCQTIEIDPDSYNTDCPEYSFVVRDYVSVTSENNGKFKITDKDLLLGQTLTLKLTGTIDFRTVGDVTVDNQNGIVKITKTTNNPTNLVTISSVIGLAVIERPQLVIEATGYAGGIQKKLLYTIPRYPAEAASRTEVDFGGKFDSNGFLK